MKSLKSLKFLTIPAVLAFSVIMAVPASAHGLTDVTLTQTCDHSTGTICVTLNAQVDVGNDERIVEFDIFASNDLHHSLGKVTFDLPANPKPTVGQGQPTSFTDTKCFPVIPPDKGSSFTIQLVSVTDKSGKASDLKFAVTINDKTINVDFTGDEDEPVTIFNNVGVCVAVSPSPSASTSASPAATAAALAQTGGLDIRFPLVGLVVLVAGAALFLVSAARGRPASR